MATMRESQSAVLERGAVLSSQLATEPFEVAWAGEARWFVEFLEPGAGTVTVQVQTSPNGLTWVDHEAPAVSGPARGMMTGAVDRLGGWLRLQVDGDAPMVRIHLALKE